MKTIKTRLSIKKIGTPSFPIAGIIASDGYGTIIAKTGAWGVPLAHSIADDIVKAVNCHDELLKSAKEFLAYFTTDGGNKSQEYLKMVRLNLKNAISEAE